MRRIFLHFFRTTPILSIPIPIPSPFQYRISFAIQNFGVEHFCGASFYKNCTRDSAVFSENLPQISLEIHRAISSKISTKVPLRVHPEIVLRIPTLIYSDYPMDILSEIRQILKVIRDFFSEILPEVFRKSARNAFRNSSRACFEIVFQKFPKKRLPDCLQI